MYNYLYVLCMFNTMKKLKRKIYISKPHQLINLHRTVVYLIFGLNIFKEPIILLTMM